MSPAGRPPDFSCARGRAFVSATGLPCCMNIIPEFRNIIPMTKTFLLGVFTVLTCWGSTVNAQSLHVNFDYAMFRYDSASTYMELYYSFDRTSLHFMPRGSSVADSLLFVLRMIPDVNDTLMYSKAWEIPVVDSGKTDTVTNRSLVGQSGVEVPSGKYKLLVNVTDVNFKQSKDSLDVEVDCTTFPKGKLSISDIELCSSITPGDPVEKGIFYKNTYNVIPNPTSLYGAGVPVVFYYFEVYNIDRNVGDSTFSVSYQLRDSFGEVHKSFSRIRKKFGESSVEVGTVNVSDVRTGAYTLIVTATDSAAHLYATSMRRLFVYNPALGAPVEQNTNTAGSAILSSVFSVMGEDQLDKEFREAGYIATSEEKSRYETLDGVDAKRRFLYEFWKKRQSQDESGTSDTRREYLERVAYANDHFRAGGREGWRTDRGRVYIIYGTPDQVDRHPNETDSKPYEVWTYSSLEGGVSFDFVDRAGFGDYSLVNSTERTEIHDDNWQQYLNAGR